MLKSDLANITQKSNKKVLFLVYKNLKNYMLKSFIVVIIIIVVVVVIIIIIIIIS